LLEGWSTFGSHVLDHQQRFPLHVTGLVLQPSLHKRYHLEYTHTQMARREIKK